MNYSSNAYSWQLPVTSKALFGVHMRQCGKKYCVSLFFFFYTTAVISVSVCTE